MDMSRSTAAGAAQDVSEDNEPPEQPIVERDPSGRWSRVDQILGRGAFKTVYKGFDEEEGIEVAWNQVRVSDLVSSKEERDRLFAEIRVLKQLKHKNIMTFYDSWLDPKTYTVNFITELFTSGTLRQYRKRHKHIDPEVLKRWAWQILCGLVYLHGHTPPIIHRDLKSDNIFINGSEGVVKIGDLGLATLLRARTAPQSVLGTPEFMAPELYDEEYDDRVDVYSFGMCLLELATLEYPYSECRNAAQIYRKVSLGVRPAGLAKVPTQELADFISTCIESMRQRRPRARQLLKHPYFASIRAEKCAAKLGEAALAHAGASAADLQQMMQECAASVAGTVSRTSSELAEVQQSLTGMDSARVSVEGLSPVEQPRPSEVLPTLEASRSVPIFGQAGIPSAVPSPPRSEIGGQGFVDGGESVATARTARDSFETASTSHLPIHEQEPSECSGLVAEPVLTGDREFCVKGKLMETEDKLNLRLRIGQHTGPSKVVEFDFDLAADTAYSVASEMVSDLSLSHEDAKMIARAIKEEIVALTEGSSPHRRYASIFSDDEDMHFSLANGHDGGVQMGSEAAGQGGSGKQVADPVQQGSHAEPSQRQSGEWASSERQINTDTLSEGCCSMMTLDNGVSSPGANAGSDASMLSRCSSAEVADDSAQSALIGRKRSSSKLNPPKDEDRTLPLKKLFENLTDVDAVAAAAAQDHGLLSNASSAAFLPNVSAPKAASVAGDAPQLDVPPKLSPDGDGFLNGARRGLGSLGRVPSVSESLNGVGLSGKSSSLKGSPVRSSRSVVASPGRSAASFARNPWSSCDSLPQVNGAPSAAGLLHNLSQPCLVRARHKEDLEQKEMRRKEAAAAMSKMEFRSLEGLDLFGVVTGCSNKSTAKGTPLHRKSIV
ncbi:probable serine/threonine-protein kinase WNK2 at N-terminal half [Coccomyxa sp. Obi]|nr:probable serine/threonine-protein kinase WNK2 at N-terminal half [Coccomyxa sp. Obi]